MALESAPAIASDQVGAAVRGSLGEVVAVFARLGLTSFGGPVAHLGYFRAEVVFRRKWVSDSEFADLVALCQFLPGPASSQMVFALGYRRAGLAGALAASLCFLLPSAVLMIAFAYGVAAAGDLATAGWLHGLKLAAVAVVAQAVWGMGRSLCPDIPRASLAVMTAAVLLLLPGALFQVLAIAVGAAIGWRAYARPAVTETTISTTADRTAPRQGSHRLATAVLILWLALLLALPALATLGTPAAVFDRFYRSGSLVFGGGHVVLPLLRAEVVPPGWVSDDQFLAGYGAAQAVPGPLFTFAAYLGAAMAPGPWAWLHGLWALLAIFLPAWLLIGGALPFWSTLRQWPAAQAALRGANAAVVGILAAALVDPVIRESVLIPMDALATALALAALQFAKAPPWLMVVAMAAAGQWLLN